MPQGMSGEMPEPAIVAATGVTPGTTPAAEPVAASTETAATTLEQMQADLAAARAALKAANNESAERRKRLEKLEADEKKRAEAEMTEAQRLQKEVADLKASNDRIIAQANERVIMAAFVAEAAKLGVVHPQDAYALADRSTVAIDDKGNVTGADKAVEALVKAGRLPTKAAQPPDINAANQGGQTTLTPDELRKRKLQTGMYSKM